MEVESLHGQTEEITKGIIKMIRKKDMEYLNGLMVENIKDIGKMESRMEKENFIMYQLILGEEEYGEKEEELIGFKILHKRKQKKLNYFLLV